MSFSFLTMKTKYTLSIFLLSGLFIFAAFKLPDDSFAQLLRKMEAYVKDQPQEKVHLHLDKPYYAVGDNIWLKAYVLNPASSAPSTISNSLYVELINERDSVKKQLKLPLIGGVAWGDMALADSLEAGNYRIRAYTNWMRNAGPDFFYDKTIKIGNSWGTKAKNKTASTRNTTAATPVKNQIDLRFFPEGGNLINQIPVKMGIKANNAAGRGMNISGSIVDETGTTISPFATTYLGMGQLILNTQPERTYTAVVRLEDGSEQRVPLPRAQPAGYVLNVNNLEDKEIKAKVYISESLLGKGELHVVAQHQGMIYARVAIPTSKQLASFSISKNEFPSGIVQLTLFDSENRPVAERLVFVNHSDEQMDLRLNTAKKVYTPREKVNVDLTAMAKGKSILGSFSVSVTNTSVVTPDPSNESNIFSSLLLRSDLPGYIEKPNDYFIDDSPATRQHLDNLMLTHGWRRFTWQDVIADKKPVWSYKPEKSLSISGTLTTNGKKPIAKGRVSLFSSSGGLIVIDTLTDANGRFVFDNLSFGDSTKFVVQGRTAKNGKYTEIKIDAVPGQVVTPNKNTGDIVVNVNETIASYVTQSNDYFEELTRRGLLQRTQVLKEVKVVTKKNIVRHSENLNGPGRADAIITAKQLETCQMLSQCLQGRVAGLVMRNGVPYLTRNGGRIPMQIVYDGIYVESDFLDAISPFDIETIEVLKNASNLAIYGSRGGGGLLIITSKRGDARVGSAYTPGVITHLAKGYSFAREFYSPDYASQNNSNQPDLRTTIYWNPQVVTEANGKRSVEFYNADTKGTYRVVVEGIDAAGNLGRAVYTYEVK